MSTKQIEIDLIRTQFCLLFAAHLQHISSMHLPTRIPLIAKRLLTLLHASQVGARA